MRKAGAFAGAPAREERFCAPQFLGADLAARATSEGADRSIAGERDANAEQLVPVAPIRRLHLASDVPRDGRNASSSPVGRG